MRKILKITGSSILVVIMLVLIIKVWADRTYFNNYDPDLSFNVHVIETERVDDTIELFGIERPERYEKVLFTMDTRPGESMPVLLTLPLEREGRVPVIVFLHGIGQSKSFLERICTPFNEAGFAMACFDQSMQGARRVQGGAFRQVAAFRQRPWKTVNDTRRLIDYLQTHPEIEPERVYLVGASYGAITGTTATALDKRIRAACLVVGGANLRVMLDAPMIRDNVRNRAMHWLAKNLVAFIMNPADPMHYAAGTAGTPVLMQNGAEDILVSPAAGEELYKALGEPKELRWYPCDHPGNRSEDAPIIVEILDDGLAWLLEQDMPFRNATERPVVPDANAVSEDTAETAEAA